jgi:hypothetical protein
VHSATRSTPLILALLLLALACGGQGQQEARPAAPGSADQTLRTRVKALIARDSRLSGPAMEAFLTAAYLDPGVGRQLWDDSLAGQDSEALPTFDGLLKVFARPWLRPLFMEAIEEDLRERSGWLKQSLRDHPGDARYGRYNVVVVGSGPNGAVAALNLRKARPGLKVALLDEAPYPASVFRTFGLFTWINSPEAPAMSTNEFVGLPLAARDLLEPGTVQGGPYFVLPEVIGDLTELAAFASGADLWLSEGVQRLAGAPGHRGLRVLPRDPALALAADHVLVAAGLGRQPDYGLPPDQAPPRLADLDAVPEQEHFDHLAARATRMVLRNRLLPAGSRPSFLAPYAGKRIAIIGSGDAANNLAELACGHAPPEDYGLDPAAGPQPGPRTGPGIGDPQGPAEVLWVNQRFLTEEAFRNGNKPRYRATLPGELSHFTLTRDRLAAVHAHGPGGLVLDLRSPAGALRQERVDYVWYGTGYLAGSSPVVRDLARHADGSPRSEAELGHFIAGLETVRGKVTVTAPGPHQGQVIETAVGRELPGSGPLAGTFLGGPVAGQLATDQELRDFTVTRNAASLNANLPRAAALGCHLADLPGYAPIRSAGARAPQVAGHLHPDPAQGRLAEEVELDGAGQGRAVSGLPPEGADRKTYEEIALRMLLARLLHGHSCSGGFSLRIWDLGPGAQPWQRRLRLEVIHLAEPDAELLGGLLASDQDLLQLARDYADANVPAGQPRAVGFRILGRPGAGLLIGPERMEITAGGD